MSTQVSATISVEMTVEVIVGTWGGEASFDSMRTQLIREAKNIVRATGKDNIKVIGEPKAIRVYMRGEEK